MVPPSDLPFHSLCFISFKNSRESTADQRLGQSSTSFFFFFWYTADGASSKSIRPLHGIPKQELPKNRDDKK